MATISVNNSLLNGVLDNNDAQHPNFPGYFADVYTLTDLVVGKNYFLGTQSSEFDAYLELINADTEEVIAQNNDYADRPDAQLTFSPVAGINYAARVTSFSAGGVGNYELTANELVAVDLELSLLIDVSISVNASEYEQQIRGYIDVFDDPDIYNNIISQGLDGKIAVNFILWSSSNRQSEVVGWTLIDSATASQQFAQTLRETLLPEFGGQRPFSGSTSPGPAIDFSDDLFFSNQFEGRRKAIEVSGDGSGSRSATSTARDNALTNGIDVINGIVIGTSSAVTNFYNDSLVGGTNADGTPAFVENASDFAEFGEVVRDVLVRELTPPAFFFVSDASSVQEGDSDNPQIVFTVSLSKAIEQTATIDFATQDGTAKASSDFVAASGTLTFAPGETSKPVVIDVIDDSRLEVDETLSLVLSNAVNVDLRDTPGIGAISDNDTLQLSGTTVNENSPSGTIVGTVAATDVSDPDPFTYSLLNNAGGRFALNGNQLQVADGSLLDFETNSSHDITVQAIDSSGNLFDQTFTLAVGDVEEDGPDTETGSLQVSINAPARISTTETDFVTVTYTNTGNADITAPLLDLSATGAQFTPINSTEFTEDSIQFLGINDTGLAGILPAGASNSFIVEFQPTAVAGEQIDFVVSTVNPDEVVDWVALQDELKPDYLSDEAWDDIYSNFTATVGNTAGDYEQLLIQNANYLSEQGEYVTDANRLVGFEFQQASDYQAIAQRSSLGSFGRGRFFIGDIQANTDADGNVAIVNAGTQRSFTLKSDGTYEPAEGDYGTLTLSNGVYTLTEPSGTVTVFNVNGQLNFIEDTNGNRITGQYSGAQLTGLVATNGDSLSFTRNGANLITAVTDSAGRTTTYTYSGELLTGVASPESSTTYTYNDDFALTSITDGNGVQASFEYDPRGRLIRESLNGGTEELIYSYGENGEVTVTDTSGATTELFFNDRGQVSQFTDALGRSLRIRYDQTGNATSIIVPDGNTVNFTYDSGGNVLTQIDPLGQRTDFSYEQNFDSLTRVIDPRGNALSYSYDGLGNLTAITYADGSSESFIYDDESNFIQSVNRRNQGISYSYNNRGQLLRQDNADGSFLAYTYDARGNLTSAADSNGTTTLEYDPADRLTRITYANGRSLTYSYDAGGRRTSMTDGEGNQVNYSYDIAGRLAGLTDGASNPIVAYSYDAAGRLAREANGNGTYTTYAYDAAGQLVSIVNFAPDDSVNSSFVYSYDELGQQTGAITLDGDWTYSYDAIGQLTGAVFTSTNADIPNQDLSYEYDAAGNRIRTVVNGEITNYTTNNLNQYESAGVAVYNYDADGNLISQTEAGNTWTYEYNYENRLVRVVDSGGVETRYEYDALGNRTATIHNGERTEYLVDPFGLGDVVAEYNGTGGLIAQYTYGIGLVSRNDGATNAFYDSNAIGSTVGLTDTTGTQVNSYSYLPFGNELAETETIVNPFEFIGQWGVMEEANGLDYMRARYYDPMLGRFGSVDPLGINGGDFNLYQYAFDTPTRYSDPIGEFAFLAAPLLGGLIGGGIDIAAQLLQNGGRLDCINWGDVVLSAGLGAFTGSLGPSGLIFGRGGTRAALNGFSGPRGFFNRGSTRFGWSWNKGAERNYLSLRRGRKHTDLLPGPRGTGTAGFGLGGGIIGGTGGISLGSGNHDCPPSEPDIAPLIPHNQELDNSSTDITSETPDAPDNQGRSKGEPHLSTFDGVGYSFQGAGEFTLVESDDLNVQVRYVEIDSRATVASAVATEIEGRTVVIDSEGVNFEDGRPVVSRGVSDDGSGPVIMVDDQIVTFSDGGEIAIGNSRLYRRGSQYTLVFAGDDGVVNDGDDQLSINYLRPGTINIVDVFLDDDSKGQVQGLLGNFNDDPADDIALPDGTVFTERPLNFTDIYGDFREAWRLQDADSSLFRFNYQLYSGLEGVDINQGPNVFFNPNFPVTAVDFRDLDPADQERGRQAALAAGYDPEDVFEFEAAAFDFVVMSAIDESLALGFLQGVETDPGADKITIINNDSVISVQLGSGFPGIITVNRTGDLSTTEVVTVVLSPEDEVQITFAPGETEQTVDLGEENFTNGEFIVEPDPDNPGSTRIRFVGNVGLVQDPVTGLLSTIGSTATGLGDFQVTLLEASSDKLYEIGVYIADDTTGQVDGVSPDDAVYAQAVMERSEVILSTIANKPNGFTDDGLRTLDLQTGEELRFYLIPGGTTDGVRAGRISSSEVIFASADTLKIAESVSGGFDLTWNIGADSQSELAFNIKAAEVSPPLGHTLQGSPYGEVLDLRRDDLTGQPIQAEFEVFREAAHDNTVGFYIVVDAQGGIDTSGDGIADVRPGDVAYTQAALAQRINVELGTDNQSTVLFEAQLLGGTILAPYIVVDDTPSALLDSDASNDPDIYFAYAGANIDGVDHIRLLGDNTFGFEDLRGGGDRDYNDMVLKASLTV